MNANAREYSLRSELRPSSEPLRQAPREIRFAVVSPFQLTKDLFRLALLSADPRFLFVADWEAGLPTIDLIVVDLAGARSREFANFHQLIHAGNRWAVLAVTDPAMAGILSSNGRGSGFGFLSHQSSLETMVHAAAVVAAGGVYFDALHASVLALQTDGPPLSNRETDVLRLIAEGYSSKEVSSILNLSIKTVEKYRTSLMQKIGVHDVVRLTHYAIRVGLVTLA